MPLVVVCVAWLAGIVVQAGLGLPRAGLDALALAGSALLVLGGRARAPERLRALATPGRVRLAGAVLYAFAFGAARYQLFVPALDERALASYNGPGWATVEGVVVADPAIRDEQIVLRVRAERVQLAGGGPARAVAGLVLVQAGRYPEYRYGERLRLSGRLETPPEAEDFSYREHLARQGIYSLMQRPRIERLAGAPGGDALLAALLALRARARAVAAVLVPEPEASVLTGILLGVEDSIPRPLLAAYSATGTTHVIAISGFNFSIVAGVLSALARRTVGERRGVFVALAGIALYAVLVGANAAVVRAAIMSGLVLVARRLGRTTYALTSLAFATLAMTFASPYTLWDPGFVLSATATLGLVLYSDPLERAARALLVRGLSEPTVDRIVALVGDALIVTTAAQITTTPYIVYTFRRLSLITLLVNFLVLPAQPPVMLWGGAGLLVGLVWLPAGQAVASVAWLCLAYTNRVIEALAAVPLATHDLDYVAPGWLWGYYAVLFGLTAAPAAWRARLKERLTRTLVLSALLIGALLVWSGVPLLPDGRLHVTVFKVEDGSAVLIQTPEGRRILVDGGPRASTTLSQLGRRLAWWDRRIDLVILTSPKAARLSGVLGVLERYDVGYVLTNGQADTPAWAALVELLARRGIPHSAALDGQRIDTGDGVTLTLLNAAPADAKAFDDDQALVVHIAYGRVSFLLPSDITAQREGELASRIPAAAVLLAGRGGAGAATSAAWLAAVQPSAVVISVAPDPRAVRPDPQLLARLQGAGLPVWRTDVEGAVEFVADGAALRVVDER